MVARGHDLSWTVIEAPFSRYAEEVRSIKLAIDVNRGVETNKVVGFTSSMPEEGKSTTSTAVALLAAQANARVILIDCDLRNPVLEPTSCSTGYDWASRGALRKCLFGRRDLQGSRDQPGLYASRLEVAFGEFQRTPRFRCHEELV